MKDGDGETARIGKGEKTKVWHSNKVSAFFLPIFNICLFRFASKSSRMGNSIERERNGVEGKEEDMKRGGGRYEGGSHQSPKKISFPLSLSCAVFLSISGYCL